MSKGADQEAYLIFENDMKERMKPVLLKLKEEEGVDVFIHQIRNTIAGCREKWKKMPKEMKEVYILKAKELVPTVSNRTPKSINSSKFQEFRTKRFEELKTSDLTTEEKSRLVGDEWKDKSKEGPTVPSSGWQLYYKENKIQALNDGVSGKSLASVLGQSWRSLAPEEKNMYKRKAYVLVKLNASSCECDLVKSKSCSVQNSETEVENKLKRHKSET